MAKKIGSKTKTPMPCQEARPRARNFSEVALGYSVEMAVAEANRCIECKNRPCIAGCPVEIDIPGFIKAVAENRFVDAAHILKSKNSLPAICGRVCPQEEQCEKVCTLGVKFEPVGVGRVERFVADWARENLADETPQKQPPNGKRVAVVGSGPAGLTVAGDLIQMGYQVTIFEALHKAGGVLVYGIPEFRLPKSIVQNEIDYLLHMGVELQTNVVIGKSLTLDELLSEEGFDAVFIGTGAGLPSFMKIPGINLIGVYSANEYLTRSNLMKAYRFPEYDTPLIRAKNVAVVGGGNTAMDSVRTALRLGADHAYLIYRRSRNEMPARHEEIEHAEEEGVQFHLLTNPVEIFGNERGGVRGMRCQRMELGEPDDSGRRRPVPVPGSEFEVEVDTVVMAVGQGANPVLTSTAPNLKTNKWGNIVADPETCATSIPGVFAGGDIVSGGATVILAMGAGRKAARSIHAYLSDPERSSQTEIQEAVMQG
ncbi:MAG: NADPH-dependent glutamate synthase [Acidobacteriia bacterium]|nr:NADPH-dependent glutamate synthase [Terriglobia bacterium]